MRPTHLFLLALPVLTACPSPEPCQIDVDALVASKVNVARVFDEVTLQAIRRDRPNPPVHARNLYHLSAAMYDAWAAYDAAAPGLFSAEKASGLDRKPEAVWCARASASGQRRGGLGLGIGPAPGMRPEIAATPAALEPSHRRRRHTPAPRSREATSSTPLASPREAPRLAPPPVVTAVRGP